MSDQPILMSMMPIPTDAPMMQGPPQGQWTLADWESLPDDGSRYEMIRGTLYMSTAPSSFHQWIIARLHELVGIPSRERKLCLAYFAPVGVLLSEWVAVQPDFVMVKMERKDIIRERRIMGAPDLVVEVLSPGSTEYDQRIKLLAYAEAAVPEYVIVDPARRELRLLKLEMPGRYLAAEVYHQDDTVEFDCVPGIRLRVGDLFDGAPDTTL